MGIRIRIQGAKLRIRSRELRSGSGSWADYKSEKVEFLHEKYTKIYLPTYKGAKAFLQGRKLDLFVNFSNFPSPYMIRAHNFQY